MTRTAAGRKARRKEQRGRVSCLGRAWCATYWVHTFEQDQESSLHGHLLCFVSRHWQLQYPQKVIFVISEISCIKVLFIHDNNSCNLALHADTLAAIGVRSNGRATQACNQPRASALASPARGSSRAAPVQAVPRTHAGAAGGGAPRRHRKHDAKKHSACTVHVRHAVLMSLQRHCPAPMHFCASLR